MIREITNKKTKKSRMNVDRNQLTKMTFKK